MCACQRRGARRWHKERVGASAVAQRLSGAELTGRPHNAIKPRRRKAESGDNYSFWEGGVQTDGCPHHNISEKRGHTVTDTEEDEDVRRPVYCGLSDKGTQVERAFGSEGLICFSFYFIFECVS
jgi:hypothetical protein